MGWLTLVLLLFFTFYNPRGNRRYRAHSWRRQWQQQKAQAEVVISRARSTARTPGETARRNV